MLEPQQAVQHDNHCFFMEYAQKHFYLQNLQIYINVLMNQSIPIPHSQPLPKAEIAPCTASTIKLHIKIPELKKIDWFSFLETWMDCSIKLSYQLHIQFSSAEVFSDD